jgi:uncharacterized membrane protein
VFYEALDLLKTSYMNIEYQWINNPSLNSIGRKRFLIFTGCLMLFIGSTFAIYGAWPILFFSLLQIAFIHSAFQSIAEHDNDYEKLTIHNSEVIIEIQRAGKLQQITWYLPWVKLLYQMSCTGRCELALCSKGQVIPIGKLINEEQRLLWLKELRSVFHVTTH